MIVRRSKSVEETEAFGEALAKSIGSGWVIGLSGDLGAGKTAFVRGLARGLGFKGRVHSPTFALLNQYEGGVMPIYHLDLYRLRGPEDVMGAGLEEYLNCPDGVSVVEWVERWCGDAGATEGVGAGTFRRVYLSSLDEHTREIAYDNAGA